MGGSSGRGPFWGLRRRLRHADDTASSSMITFIVGTSVFLISSAVMLHFVAEPPGGTSGLEHADLKAKANNALAVLLGTPGVPVDWGDSPEKVDTLTRLGLVENGANIRLDPLKFRALANGSYTTQSADNGRVDYGEALEALSLEGYNFHLRAYPLFEPFNSTTYGVEGMEGFSVAYIGDWDGIVTEAASSKSERYSLDALAVAFNNTTRESVFGTGDAYRDDKDQLRNFLVPLLGNAPSQTVISAGSGTPKYDFSMITKSTCETVLTVTPGLCSRGLALVDPDDTTSLGYTKSREVRSVLGLANLSASTSGTLASVTWNEWLKNHGDADDHGWIEVSPDDGDTWYTIASSSDTTTLMPGTYTGRAASITSANCGPCAGAKEVWVALHWVADNTASSASPAGWLVDNVQVTVGLDIVFTKTFEDPAYDLLVIGSNVDQNALTAAEVKNAIRDYVQLYGGRLLVLGGQTTTNWLQPLFHVGIREGSPGVATPDSTHPLLTIPNQLDWEGFDHDEKVWDFSAQGAEELFNMVVGSGEDDHVLSLSSAGAFGDTEGDGVVMLTTYLPHTMTSDQAKRFFANALTYGRYHRLYMEVGPEVPSTEAVAAVTRTATMDKTAVEGDEYIEMAFILYVWQGASSPTILPIQVTPKPPASLTAEAAESRIYLNWTPPSDSGAGEVIDYNIYRGTMSGTETWLANTGANNTSYVDLEVANGQTYYYNVTAVNGYGQGSSSVHRSATPITTPGAPSQPALVTSVPGQIALTWSAPSSNGGASIVGYAVYRSEDNVTFTLRAQVSTTSYTDSGSGFDGGKRYYYNVTANNSVGEGPASPVADGASPSVPTAPTSFTALGGVGNVTLEWLPPLSDGGEPLTGYRIYRGTTPGSTTLLVEVGAGNATFTDLEVVDGTTYYYNMTAVNAVGEGTSTAEESATTAGAPHAPTSFTAADAGVESIGLAWLAPVDDGGSPITHYEIWRGTSSGSQSFLRNTTGAVLSEVDTPAIGTYYYHVRAVNALGTSGPSNVDAGTRTA